MAASRASKSAPKPVPEHAEHRSTPQPEVDLVELQSRLAVVEQTLRTVVEELKARKVLPDVVVARGRKRVHMSPEAVRAQRQKLLADARKRRWATPQRSSEERTSKKKPPERPVPPAAKKMAKTKRRT